MVISEQFDLRVIADLSDDLCVVIHSKLMDKFINADAFLLRNSKTEMGCEGFGFDILNIWTKLDPTQIDNFQGFLSQVTGVHNARQMIIDNPCFYILVAIH